MVITLGPELEAMLSAAARHEGVPPEELAVHVLRERLQSQPRAVARRDDWEQGLVSAAQHCGLSLPDAALGSEGLYE